MNDSENGASEYNRKYNSTTQSAPSPARIKKKRQINRDNILTT